MAAASDPGSGDVPAAVLARVFDCTERRVQQLARDGVIPRSGRGKYPFFAAVRAYIAFLREAGAVEKAGAAFDPERLDPFKQRAWYDAQIQKLELGRKLGTLTPRSDHEEVLGVLVDLFVRFLETLADRTEREGFADHAMASRIGEWTDQVREEMFTEIARIAEAQAARREARGG